MKHETNERPRGLGSRCAVVFGALVLALGIVVGVEKLGEQPVRLNGFVAPVAVLLAWPALVVLPDEADEQLGLPLSIGLGSLVVLPWLAVLAYAVAWISKAHADR